MTFFMGRGILSSAIPVRSPIPTTTLPSPGQPRRRPVDHIDREEAYRDQERNTAADGERYAVSDLTAEEQRDAEEDNIYQQQRPEDLERPLTQHPFPSRFFIPRSAICNPRSNHPAFTRFTSSTPSTLSMLLMMRFRCSTLLMSMVKLRIASFSWLVVTSA